MTRRNLLEDLLVVRETSYTVREAFTKGLRPYTDVPPGTSFLSTMKGMKATNRGLVDIRVPAFPVGGRTGTPYSSIFFQGSELLLLDTEDGQPGLFVVDQEAWTIGSDLLSTGTPPLASDNSTAYTLTYDGSIGMVGAEIDGTWFLCNGSEYLTNCQIYGGWVAGRISADPVPTAVCIFNNRMFFGGIVSSADYQSTDRWAAAKKAWLLYSETDGAPGDHTNIDGSWIFWGSSGGGSFDQPFLLENVLLSGYQEREYVDALIAGFRDGSLGMAKVPWGGTVTYMRQLGSSIAIYTTLGIGLAAVTEKGLSFLQIANTKIPGIMAVDGNEAQHVYVDKLGIVGYLSGEGNHRELDYREFLSSLATDARTAVVYDTREGDFYVTLNASGTPRSWILTRDGGFTETDYPVTSIASVRDSLRAVVGSGTGTFSFTTHRKDSKLRGIKTVQTVELSQELCTVLKAQVGFRYAKGVAWDNSPLKPFNLEDVVYPTVSAVDFRIRVQGTYSTGASVDSIQVRWKTSDRRSVRGLTEQPAVES